MSFAKKIGIVGAGNVAFQLIHAFRSIEIPVTLLYNRDAPKAHALAEPFDISVTDSIAELTAVDLIICCTSDDSLAELIPELSNFAPVVTTSGTVDVGSFPHKHPIGVFYPLQTFTQGKIADFSSIPIFVEADSDFLLDDLIRLGQQLSNTVVELPAAQRQYLHIAAVMVNNFTNHLIDLSQEFTQQHDIQFEWLLPLLNETVSKVQTQHAFDCQTGPARRKDFNTIEKHLSLLPETLKPVYSVLTQSILKRYSNND